MKTTLAEWEDTGEEISALVGKLHETQQRLLALTRGEVDAVLHPDGHSYLLHEAQEKLRQSEERFRSMFTAAATGIAISTPQGWHLRANEAYCRMLGYTEEELRGRNFASLTHPEDLTLNLKMQDELLAGRRENFVMETRYLKKNGAVMWTRHSVSATHADGGEIATLMVIAEDITEGKLAEFRLHRLNRLHTVLSRIGEAVVRTGDRQQLYDTVCRIVVEDGLLRMVFIAEVDAEARVARPAASHGEGREYLRESTSVIPMDRGPLSRGTVGTALRTGVHDVCNDIAGTLRMQPWHAAALQHGLLANASFPLHLRGAIVGVLVLYAGETGYFLDDEIRLMVSVASNVSFALEALEKERERQKAEEAVRRQQAELQVVFDLVPAMVCFKDTENVFLRVNRRLAEATGKSIAEIEGKSAAELFPREAAKYHADDLEVIRSGAPKLGIVEKLRSPEDKELWVQTDKVPVCDKDGKVIGIVVLTQDITGRKLAEAALRHSEERLRLITNLVPHGIFAKDAAGCHIFANPALAELAGLSIEEILGKNDFDLVANRAEAEAYRADDLAVMQSGSKMVIAEEPRTDLCGRTRILQTIKIPFTVPETGEPAVLGVCMDITERKRTEARFRRLVDSNAQGVIFWNTKGEITDGNDAFLRLVGYTHGDLKAGDINWVTLTPPEYAHLDRHALDELAATGVCTPFEKEFVLQKRFACADTSWCGDL